MMLCERVCMACEQPAPLDHVSTLCCCIKEGFMQVPTSACSARVSSATVIAPVRVFTPLPLLISAVRADHTASRAPSIWRRCVHTRIVCDTKSKQDRCFASGSYSRPFVHDGQSCLRLCQLYRMCTQR